jgi:GxxExxY protein
MTPMKERDQLTERIIGCCFKVHKDLGPGFNEKIYHHALMQLLDQKGIKYQTEKEFGVFYLDKKIGSFRADRVVEDEVILEVKSLAGNTPALFQNQLISYLRVSGLHIGLLINFGNKSCQVKRVVF